MLLEVENVEIVYNDVILAANGVSLSVPERGKVALLGSNGAGKTTILRAIAGTLGIWDGDVKRGAIMFDGQRIDGRPAEEVIRLGIAMVPEGRRVFAELTVDENIRLGAFSRRDAKGVREDYEKCLEFFPVLRERRRQLAGYLSGGEQQMVAVARAYMSRPKLLMCDEPSLGLAPKIVDEILDILDRINADGCAILLIEQNASLALEFSEYGYIIENGKIVLDGPSRTLMDNEDVREFYLGMSQEGAAKSYRNVKTYKRRKRWLA